MYTGSRNIKKKKTTTKKDSVVPCLAPTVLASFHNAKIQLKMTSLPHNRLENWDVS
uniref:Uncharacterized protein n=1 Tax=Anguilla anguilla TaxID=7936 RepID=A0A0E9RX54_ANGAN